MFYFTNIQSLCNFTQPTPSHTYCYWDYCIQPKKYVEHNFTRSYYAHFKLFSCRSLTPWLFICHLKNSSISWFVNKTLILKLERNLPVVLPKTCLFFCILQLPFTQACLSSENPYERKGGLMCMAVLAEGCADHIRTK